MNEQEPLDRFLYGINRKQTWAGLFTFAMTVFGLLAVIGLVVLTVWGFSSYDKANTKLNETNAELANSQQKIAELTNVTNSDQTKADLLKAQTDLADARKEIELKNQLIAELQKQPYPGTAPSSPAGPAPDCPKCESQGNEDVSKLKGEIESLQKRLRVCESRVKGKEPDKTTILN